MLLGCHLMLINYTINSEIILYYIPQLNIQIVKQWLTFNLGTFLVLLLPVFLKFQVTDVLLHCNTLYSRPVGYWSVSARFPFQIWCRKGICLRAKAECANCCENECKQSPNCNASQCLLHKRPPKWWSLLVKSDLVLTDRPAALSTLMHKHKVVQVSVAQCNVVQ